MKKLAILASHNGSGFEAIQNAIANEVLQASIEVVISNNSDAKVLSRAEKFGIPSYVTNKSTDINPDEKIAQLLKEYGCTHVFLSGYMKKISSELTKSFKIINSHPSLLPAFGGVGMYGRFVHEAVVAANAIESGVTIHEVNENYDEGKIILQKKLTLTADETVDSLENKIKSLEKIAIVEALQKCLN